jgi:hypothetical protein
VASTISDSPDPRPSITISRPPEAATGDVLVASVVVNGDPESLAAPGGWSLVRDDAIPGVLRQAVYVKVAGVTEPDRYTWTLPEAQRVAGRITAYSGIAAGHPVDDHAASVQPEPGSAIAAPRLTISVPDTRLVLLTATASDAPPSATDTTQAQVGLTEVPLAAAATRQGPAIAAILALRPAAAPLPADSDPPDARIHSGPPATVTSSTARFVFSADEPASFTCALDSGAPAPCSSPVMYNGLTPGSHTLTVRSTDTAGNADPAPAARTWTVEASPTANAVLVGAGDIADCTSQGDEATAALVEGIRGTVFTAGDNAYLNGTAKEFANCYGPTWGRFKNRTMPAPGNHEYQSGPKAAGYYRYFGAAAGDPEKGYYDYTLGSWHVIVLSTTCWAGGCEAGSAQEQWLRSVLAASKVRCTVAITHHPRFSSGGEHGSSPTVQPLWQALYDHGAELVLAGHDHVYERFAPQRPGGVADAAFGLREFVVGTGGRDHRRFGPAVRNSEVRNNDTFGVLKLTLHRDRYDWEFVPEAGKSFTDSGTGACHGAPPRVTVPGPGPIEPGPVKPGPLYPVATDTPAPSTTTPTS